MRAAIILAAGRSRRFGTRDKLLVCWRGVPLIAHAIGAALASPCARVIVVVDGRQRRRIDAVRRTGVPRVELIFVDPRSDSRRDSLAAGLSALRPIDTEALILLGDLPTLPVGIDKRLTRCRADQAIRASFRGIPGHPVLLRDPAAALDRLRQGKSPFATASYLEAGRGAISDIDRPSDLRPVAR